LRMLASPMPKVRERFLGFGVDSSLAQKLWM
jgi:hypothetical protein